jgi:hypothetical protein
MRSDCRFRQVEWSSDRRYRAERVAGLSRIRGTRERLCAADALQYPTATQTRHLRGIR